MALITAVIYVVIGSGMSDIYQPGAIEWVKVIPYVVVLLTALMGINVMVVLFIGILLSGLTGLFTGLSAYGTGPGPWEQGSPAWES